MITGQCFVAFISKVILKSLLGQVWELATPKNISYLWGFGRFLGIVMVVQVISGFFLAFYYVRGVAAWESVIEITREVSYGWVLRLVHRNGASFVFIVLFTHFVRGLVQSSFYLTWAWVRGWTIMFLTIAAAFLGYVLPWGQMSVWGATVIINLLRVLPKGKTLVIWLWGGFYVSNFTCRFFYAIHFLVPFLVLATAGVHLILLHLTGSSVPGGLRARSSLKVKFRHILTFKDVVNCRILWIFWLWALSYPDWAADPVNFVVADLSNSPLHIQPEWYFLHFYAVLRSIPNKLGGLVGFALALAILLFLAALNSEMKLNHLSSYNIAVWFFLFTNLLLIWLGGLPVEAPFIEISQVLRVVYFSYFLISYILSRVRTIVWRAYWIANSSFVSSQGTVYAHS